MLKTSSCRTHRVLRRHSLCGSFLGSRLARSERVAVTGHRRRADRTSPDPNEHCRRSSPGDAARLLWVRRVRPLWLWVRDEPAVELLCVHIRNVLAVELLRIRIRIVPAVELLRIRIRIVPAVELLRVGIWVIPAVELLRVPKQGVLPPLSQPLCVRPVLSPFLFLLTWDITAARDQIRNSVASTSA
jgi:hypothetical protein